MRSPPREPFFEELGRLRWGNASWCSSRAITTTRSSNRGWPPAGIDGDPGPLAPEQLLEPAEVSPAIATIAGWCSPARVRVAYPGIWVREDVYATHGHYLDCHMTVPTLERLSMGVMSRLLRRPAASFGSVEDYESIGAPVFAWRDAVARNTKTGAALNGMATVNAWQALGGASGSAPGAAAGRSRGRLARLVPARTRVKAIRRAFPWVVAGLNRAGVGPLRADISPVELRRAGLRAMGEVAARLELGDAFVIFGHTHRAGPFPGDDELEWRGPGGARLVNTGSWTYSSIFMDGTGSENPYWPGVCVLVGPSGPPMLARLLRKRLQEELTPPRA